MTLFAKFNTSIQQRGIKIDQEERRKKVIKWPYRRCDPFYFWQSGRRHKGNETVNFISHYENFFGYSHRQSDD